MNLEPSVAEFVTLLARSPVPDIPKGEPAAARGMLSSLMGNPPRRALARVEDHTVHLNGADLLLRLYADTTDPLACILYLHGGGWVLGSVEESDPFARELAHVSQCLVVSVDYRLAPEHPFPAGLDDAYAALQWVGSHLTTLAGRSLPIVVLGDSAGGNLATVVAARAHQENGPAIALQVLAYPVTDCDLDTPSYLEFADGPLLTREWMAWFFHHYAGVPSAWTDPRISPLRSASLKGQPPAFILTAEYDPLRDEGEAYAERLRQSGIPTLLRRYAHQIHGFVSRVGLSSANPIAIADMAAFIREHCPRRP